MEIKVKILPGASFTQIVGYEGPYLKIRINAQPEKGKANAALIAFLAKHLLIAKSKICVLRGETSRIKTLSIDMDRADFDKRVEMLKLDGSKF